MKTLPISSLLLTLLFASFLPQPALAAGPSKGNQRPGASGVRYGRVKPTRALRTGLRKAPHVTMRLANGRKAILARGKTSFHLFVQKRIKTGPAPGPGKKPPSKKLWVRVAGLSAPQGKDAGKMVAVNNVRLGRERLSVKLQYSSNGRADHAQVHLPGTDAAVTLRGSRTGGFVARTFRFVELTRPMASASASAPTTTRAAFPFPMHQAGRVAAPQPRFPIAFHAPRPAARPVEAPWAAQGFNLQRQADRVQGLLMDGGLTLKQLNMSEAMALRDAIRQSSLPLFAQLGVTGSWYEVDKHSVFPPSHNGFARRQESRVVAHSENVSAGRRITLGGVRLVLNGRVAAQPTTPPKK